MDDDLDTPTAVAQLASLATLALESGDPRERVEASATVRDLGERIIGLRLAASPSRPEVGEAVST
jgi:hypothetical protein